MTVASPAPIPPPISSSRPGIPLEIRPVTSVGRSGVEGLDAREDLEPGGLMRKVCLPSRWWLPRIFTTRSQRRSIGSRGS